MQTVIDLHLHSKYARAVSPKMDLQGLANWANRKGIDVLATGDWTYPLWFNQINDELEETSPGLFELKDRKSLLRPVRFILGTEISCIYRQGGKTRRVHNLIFSPSLKAAQAIIIELKKRGANLEADGRPIIGLSSRDLLALILGVDPACFFIPAHIWTPWFAVFGSKSGFDSLEECFTDLASHITAIETGLSSDPLMNWRIKELDSRLIVSFSDAHSGPKMGREATILEGKDELDYVSIIRALQQNNPHLKVSHTLEYFAEEGKYHYSGNRKAGIRFTPEEEREMKGIYPREAWPVTIGVANQVEKLANRWLGEKEAVLELDTYGNTLVYDPEKKRQPFISVVPLLEILHEVTGGPTKAEREYTRLIADGITELDFLLRSPLKDIEIKGGERLALAIKNVRSRNVTIEPGYDGVFGKVRAL